MSTYLDSPRASTSYPQITSADIQRELRKSPSFELADEETEALNALRNVFPHREYEELYEAFKYFRNTCDFVFTRMGKGIEYYAFSIGLRNDALHMFFDLNLHNLKKQMAHVKLMELRGKGMNKKHFFACDCSSFKAYSIALLPIADVDNARQEIEMHEELKSIKGCVCAKRILWGSDSIALMSPYCDLGTMEEANGRPVSYERILIEFIECATILVAVHEKGLIHLDLKPDNIMYKSSKVGGEPEIRIIDFGNAKKITADGFDGKLKCPFSYMPPEILEYYDASYEGMDLDAQIDAAKRLSTAEPIELMEERKVFLRRISDLKTLISKPADVFMLGLSLHARKNEGKLPTRYESMKSESEKMDINNNKQVHWAIKKALWVMSSLSGVVKKPENETGLDYLIWQMLQLDPAKRPTMVEVKERLIQMKSEMEQMSSMAFEMEL